MKYRIIYSTLFISLLFSNCQPSKEKDLPRFIISNEELHEVDSRIFGQFLEKPSWGGEIGPEAAYMPQKDRLQDSVLSLLKTMNIPLLRFPGGTDVDHMDWRDMVDNVPGRSTERPISIGHRGDTITNYFGYDEALQLAEELDSEMILVVNFGQAYYGENSIEEAANDVAALIAYCNASVGSDLPKGMYDWPSLRAQNGHPEPYDVRYVQIANEPWVLDKRLKINGDIDDSLRNHFFGIHKEYIRAIRTIDPDIDIIVDGNCEEIARYIQPELGNTVQFVAHHVYYPWQLDFLYKNDEKVAPDTLEDEQIWNAWVAFPQMNPQGNSTLQHDMYQHAKSAGYPIATTEWNWNGWWNPQWDKRGVLDSKMAQGLGAAGFLHAFIREGRHIKMAIQSMLLGNSWGITAIRVDPEQKMKPHFYPTGKVTGFYANHHGNKLLKIEAHNIPAYQQPYRLNALNAHEKVNYLDVLATRSDDKLYVHVINRHMDTSRKVAIQLQKLAFEDEVVHHYLSGPIETGDINYVKEMEETLTILDQSLVVDIPARSVSIFEFLLK